MNSLWRQERTYRIRADDLLQKIPGGISQIIATEFWEAEAQGESVSITGVGGIASSEIFGTPSLAAIISGAGIPSAAVFGQPSIGAIVVATGIVTAEEIGSPGLSALIFALGIPTGEAFGRPIIGDGVNYSLSDRLLYLKRLRRRRLAHKKRFWWRYPT